ncbi:cardiolipin synthase [Marinobacter daqiaonensis]|uniref:CDP-diacylglycerol--glycerol-3-phosphate 3-phosphatidyltransferase n=1 Tax=Marinobacter daqiaonensis TaxID=650891 RepID=A0A1I6GG27_9GAMM|nr:CDP-alcohol phosphatidyltransferase family protein [Marinobacter daqiaonensis]SFR41152.1 cardiolipin synthase [Marinobacter daqiaonensis]
MKNFWRWIPNALTFLRILLVMPFAYMLASGQYRLALALFIIASVTDGLDGLLARAFGWKSRLGAIADPLADKLLMLAAYLVLSLTMVLPWWLFAVVLIRDVVIIGGGLMFHRLIGPFDVTPSMTGKLNTLIQIMAALAVIMIEAGFDLPPWSHTAAVWSVTVMAIISGSHYVALWGLRAMRGRAS